MVRFVPWPTLPTLLAASGLPPNRRPRHARGDSPGPPDSVGLLRSPRERGVPRVPARCWKHSCKADPLPRLGRLALCSNVCFAGVRLAATCRKQTTGSGRTTAPRQGSCSRLYWSNLRGRAGHWSRRSRCCSPNYRIAGSRSNQGARLTGTGPARVAGQVDAPGCSRRQPPGCTAGECAAPQRFPHGMGRADPANARAVAKICQSNQRMPRLPTPSPAVGTCAGSPSRTPRLGLSGHGLTRRATL